MPGSVAGVAGMPLLLRFRFAEMASGQVGQATVPVGRRPDLGR